MKTTGQPVIYVSLGKSIIIIIIIIVVITIIIILMYILIVFAMGSLGLSVNKTPQTSSTFLTILAGFSNTVFCNSTICVLIPIPSNLFVRSGGIVPKDPSTIGTTFTFQIFFNSRARS